MILNKTNVVSLAVIYQFIFIGAAEAYVGPTLGIGILGVLIGVVCVVGITLYALIIKPFRKIISSNKKKAPSEETSKNNLSDKNSD